jgi:hypothetical protein
VRPRPRGQERLDHTAFDTRCPRGRGLTAQSIDGFRGKGSRYASPLSVSREDAVRPRGVPCRGRLVVFISVPRKGPAQIVTLT